MLSFFGLMYSTDENSTRNSIIRLLKRFGDMSIEDLSKDIDITPMGIRQHLLALEKKGFVTYSVKKRGIGRPGFSYRLTPKAEKFFPRAYDSLVLEMLRDIEKHDGPEKIDMIFQWRKERLLEHKKGLLSGHGSIDELMRGLKEILESNGHMVEVSESEGNYHLRKFHCPINRISNEFKDACKHELFLYQDLLGRNITRTHSIADGAQSCLFVIPKA